MTKKRKKMRTCWHLYITPSLRRGTGDGSQVRGASWEKLKTIRLQKVVLENNSFHVGNKYPCWPQRVSQGLNVDKVQRYRPFHHIANTVYLLARLVNVFSVLVWNLGFRMVIFISIIIIHVGEWSFWLQRSVSYATVFTGWTGRDSALGSKDKTWVGGWEGASEFRLFWWYFPFFHSSTDWRDCSLNVTGTPQGPVLWL